jgi:hypothetical protein
MRKFIIAVISVLFLGLGYSQAQIVDCNANLPPNQGANLCNSGVTSATNTPTVITITNPRVYPQSSNAGGPLYEVLVRYFNGGIPPADCNEYLFVGCSIVSNSVAQTITITLPSGQTLDDQALDGVFKSWINIRPVGTTTWLPLTLTSFTATRINGSDGYTRVRLIWETAQESNTSHFLVERSNDLINFYTTVMRVPAAGNSSMPITYTYYDSFPTNGDNLYRLKMVDLDNSFTFSPYRLVRLTGANVQPVTQVNCAGTIINGPAQFCYGPEQYTLSMPILQHCTYNWAASPASIATATPNWNQATVWRTGSATGPATVSAYISRCTPATANVYKNIQIGNQPLMVQTSNTGDNCPGSPIRHTAWVINYGNTPSTSYSWYRNGVYDGTGYSRVFIVMPNQFLQYQVIYHGPCGQETYYGSQYGGGTNPVRFTVTPVPANTEVQVARRICDIERISANTATRSSAVTVEFYDLSGNMKKRVISRQAKGNITIPTRDLPTGNYIMRITENGQTETKQIRIEH